MSLASCPIVLGVYSHSTIFLIKYIINLEATSCATLDTWCNLNLTKTHLLQKLTFIRMIVGSTKVLLLTILCWKWVGHNIAHFKIKNTNRNAKTVNENTPTYIEIDRRCFFAANTKALVRVSRKHDKGICKKWTVIFLLSTSSFWPMERLGKLKVEITGQRYEYEILKLSL